MSRFKEIELMAKSHEIFPALGRMGGDKTTYYLIQNSRNRKQRESAEDDERSGRPQSSPTAENIEKVSALVRKNMLQTIAQMAELVEIYPRPHANGY
ncbi:hypothetical protein TNCV_89481 [Trichonephila clavipes]|nr:hypothetical protein TNCV_89481 [Trichonephila clavipes]